MKFKFLLILTALLLILTACSSMTIVQDLQSTAVAGTLQAIQAQTATASGIQAAVAATVAAQGGAPGEPSQGAVATPAPGSDPGTSEPGAAPTPTPTTTPAAQDLVLGETGYSQENRQLVLGFTIENPNAELTITGANSTVTIYDASGKVLFLDEFPLPVLLPGQETGIARDISLPEGSTAASLQIDLENGTATQTGSLAPLTAREVVFRQTENFKRVLGEICNPFPFFINNIEVDVLLFDAGGRIVGGGLQHWNYVSGENDNGFSISVSGDSSAVRAAAFPHVRRIPAAVFEDKRPEGAVLPEVVSVEFIQTAEGYPVYTVELRNPNSGFAIPRTLFNVIGYTVDGSIHFQAGNLMYTLGPEMSSVVSGFGSWVAQDERLDRVEVRLSEDLVFEPSGPIPAITFENVQYNGDEIFGYTFTTDVINPHPVRMENVRVYFVARDANGALMYADYESVSLVPAGQTIVVEKWMPQLKAEPASVTVYALVPEYDDLVK